MTPATAPGSGWESMPVWRRRASKLEWVAAATWTREGSQPPQAGKAPLAGNTIGTDRAFIAKYMPRLDSYLHYRNVDVSSVKEVAKRWYPRAYHNAPAKNGGHRALADILESIREMAYYRAAVFVPQPGPTSEEARTASAATIELYSDAE